VPGIDHYEQLEALQSAADSSPDVRLRVVDCLNECDRSNIAVIRRPHLPKPARDLWLERLNTPRVTQALAAWLQGGASDALPPVLVGLQFRHLAPARRR